MNEDLFNTKTEYGLRCLFILKELYPISCDIDRLVCLDYLCLYIEDIEKKGTNLHPEYPFRSIEIYERRIKFKDSLLELVLKNLIDLITNDDGICFEGNSNTFWFAAGIENTYSRHLVNNIQLVLRKTKLKSTGELKKIILNSKNDELEYGRFYPYVEEV